MADLRRQLGVTLIEMMVVLGVIVILAGAIIVLTLRVENQSKEKLLANTFSVLENALGQFYDYGFQYSSPYTELRFPVDCNGVGFSDLQTALATAMGATGAKIVNHDEASEPEFKQYSGCEAMYFFLSRVPESRQMLTRIEAVFVTNKNKYGQDITITMAPRPAEPLLRVVDPWGTTLKYNYYVEHLADKSLAAPKDFLKTCRGFPVLVSAGPDKKFDTVDDISSNTKWQPR